MLAISFVLAYSIGYLVYSYLQQGTSYQKRFQSDQIRRNKQHLQHLHGKYNTLSKEYLNLDQKFTNLTKLSMDRTRSLTSIVEEYATRQAISDIFQNEVDNLQKTIQQNLSYQELKESSDVIRTRLILEIGDLRRRSNANLVIGIIITLCGLYLLWNTIQKFDSLDIISADAEKVPILMFSVLPRLTLVIFIEFFSYFFLRLYKSGLSEVKYFQNELTNIESKLVSAHYAYLTEDGESLASALKSLSTTERNFILEKGQSTTETKRYEADRELLSSLIKKLPELNKTI